MNKYCPICGIENLKEAVFCVNCGVKFDVGIPTNNLQIQQENNNGMMPQYYGQTQQYTPQKPSKIVKPIIATAIVLGVVAVLIVALLSGGAFDGLDYGKENINKEQVGGGPKANLGSIVSGGNALTTPAEGHTAVYGYYMSGIKIGSISFNNIGEEYYQGELCYKVKGSGNFDFEIYGQSIGMNFDIHGYESKYDSTLLYCEYDFSVGYSSYDVNMGGTMNVDKENGKIMTTIYDSATGSITTVIEVPDDFWTTTNLQDNLYVGYINEVSYTMSVDGYDTAVILRISVTGQEDVTVAKGTFEDCYKVKIEQMTGVVTTTSYMWIDQNNICPKMQISNSAASLGYGDLTLELEEYYTTYL